MKFSITKLVIAGFFLGFVVLVRFAMRDINLNIDLLRESLENLPGIVMENIQFAREISGDTWRIRIPYLERDGDIVSVKSLDVRREIKSGGEWYFFGSKGTYQHDIKSASLLGLLGTLDTGERVWNLESPRLNWQEKNNTFSFPEGFTIYDDEFMLKTPNASMDESGVILLERGGVIQWLKPLEQF
ncbi:MAG: hypothetical protein IJT21_02115 [Synergistaceae bacterium]|nr:hypothetical protein [Synergistaceae bacterium]